MLETILWHTLLVGSAFLAGVINTIAGGGTLLTFPALMQFGGLNSVLANGTSTVALMPGSLAGAWGFRRELGNASRWLILLIPPSLVGGTVGTLLVVSFSARIFDQLVPWLLLTASLLFLAQPWLARRFPPRADTGHPSAGMVLVLIFFQFLVAIYGGYFGAGIGILMLTSLGLMGLADIYQMNAVKTILAAAINAASIVVWLVKGQVHGLHATEMMLGAIAGGYSGALLGRRLPRLAVRWFVILVGFGLSAYYFLKPPSS